MKENYRGQMVFMAERYGSEEEYRKVVADQIFLLMSNEYQLKVYTELGEKAQTIIEYGYLVTEYEDYLEWCDQDDMDALLNDRYARENEWVK